MNCVFCKAPATHEITFGGGGFHSTANVCLKCAKKKGA